MSRRPADARGDRDDACPQLRGLLNDGGEAIEDLGVSRAEVDTKWAAIRNGDVDVVTFKPEVKGIWSWLGIEGS